MTVTHYQQFELIPPQQKYYTPLGMSLHFKHAINIPQGTHYPALSLTVPCIRRSYYVKVTFLMRVREKFKSNRM